jgi:serine O-acetyltransferase
MSTLNNLDNASTMVSAEIADWSREEKSLFSWDPSRSLLASIRSYQCHAGSRNPIRILAKKFAVLRHRFWSVVSGADIPLNCCIGGGLVLPHPNGIVIHSDVKIGPNCLIFQQVTIGVTSSIIPPVIGGHVDIGAGAIILGNIKIGDHARIGAHALVCKDVPAGKTARNTTAIEIY